MNPGDPCCATNDRSNNYANNNRRSKTLQGYILRIEPIIDAVKSCVLGKLLSKCHGSSEGRCDAHVTNVIRAERSSLLLSELLFCFVLVSAMYQAAELAVSAKLHLPMSLLTKLNSITMDHSCFGALIFFLCSFH